MYFINVKPQTYVTQDKDLFDTSLNSVFCFNRNLEKPLSESSYMKNALIQQDMLSIPGHFSEHSLKHVVHDLMRVNEPYFYINLHCENKFHKKSLHKHSVQTVNEHATLTINV